VLEGCRGGACRMSRATDVGLGILTGAVLALLFINVPATNPEVRPPSVSAPRGTSRNQKTELKSPGSEGTAERSNPKSPNGARVSNSKDEWTRLLESPISPPRNDVERALLKEILAKGSEDQRAQSAKRLGLSILRSVNGDPEARAILEQSIRSDPAEDVRAMAMEAFWQMPDDGFEIFLERLLFDPSEEVKLEGLRLIHRAVSKEDRWLDGMLEYPIAQKFSRDQLADVCHERKRRLLTESGRIAQPPGRVADYAAEVLEKLNRFQ